MRLITIFELATRSDSELQALFRETADELTRCTEGTSEWSHTLATLENIFTARRLHGQRPKR